MTYAATTGSAQQAPGGDSPNRSRRVGRSLSIAYAITLFAVMYVREALPFRLAEATWLVVTCAILASLPLARRAWLPVYLAGLAYWSSVVLSIAWSDGAPFTGIMQTGLGIIALISLSWIFNKTDHIGIKLYVTVSSSICLFFALCYFVYFIFKIDLGTLYIRGSNVRLQGLHDTPNYFASTTIASLVICMVAVRRKIVSFYYLFPVLTATILTLSRAALLAIFVALITACILRPKLMLKLIASLLVATCLFLIALNIPLFRDLLDFLLFRFGDGGGGAQERLEVALGGVAEFWSSANWIFGFGRWDYEASGYSNPAHNGLATILIDHGLLGAATFLLLSFAISTRSLASKKDRLWAAPCLAALFTLLLFNDFHIYRDWWFGLAAVLCLAPYPDFRNGAQAQT